MPRLTELEDIMFPVELMPVFAGIDSRAGGRMLPAHGRRAIVNLNTGDVLGIVGRSYRLVTNKEALDMAVECCRTVFPETKPSEWKVDACDAPGTGGHCYIDLSHNSRALDFSVLPPDQRPDIFGPFIRVTNSYNTLRALSFDIGFYRKVCKNGLIVPDAIIRFTFTHSRCDIAETVHFEIARERLSDFRGEFMRSLQCLRGCAVPRRSFLPLVCAVLMFRPPHDIDAGRKEEEYWRGLCRRLDEMADRYAGELGENSYAVFNVITELASNPPEDRFMRRDRHSMQRLAGAWLESFKTECSKQDFKLDGYIAKLAQEKS